MQNICTQELKVQTKTKTKDSSNVCQLSFYRREAFFHSMYCGHISISISLDDLIAADEDPDPIY